MVVIAVAMFSAWNAIKSYSPTRLADVWRVVAARQPLAVGDGIEYVWITDTTVIRVVTAEQPDTYGGWLASACDVIDTSAHEIVPLKRLTKRFVSTGLPWRSPSRRSSHSGSNICCEGHGGFCRRARKVGAVWSPDRAQNETQALRSMGHRKRQRRLRCRVTCEARARDPTRGGGTPCAQHG